MPTVKPLKHIKDELYEFNDEDVISIENGGTESQSVSEMKAKFDLETGVDIQGFSQRLENLSNLDSVLGFLTQIGLNSFTKRSLNFSSDFSITNQNGASGNPSIALSDITEVTTGQFLKFEKDSKGRITGITPVTTTDITNLVNSIYLKLSGGTLTGPLALQADPVDNLNPVTKQYQDSKLALKLDLSLLGAVNGVAPLGSDSKIPSVYLPSFVDDVLEFVNQAAFPVTGTSGVLYISTSTNQVFRWTGSAYMDMSLSTGTTDYIIEGTNLYFTAARVLAVIMAGFSTSNSSAVNSSDSLITAIGKIQAQINNLSSSLTTHLSNTSNPHSVTAAQVGLGNVNNTSDVDKPVSTATTSVLGLKFDKTGGTITGAVNTPDYVSVASATNVVISSVASNAIKLTGTNTVATFDTLPSGAIRKFTFTGILVLTHSVNLILPGAVNITTAANDTMELISEGGGIWRCLNYFKNSGSSLAGGGSSSGAFTVTNSKAYILTNTIADFGITIPATYVANVKSIRLTNISSTVAENVKVRLIIGGVSYHIASLLPIPAKGAVELLKQPKILVSGNTIEGSSTNSNNVHAIVTWELVKDTSYINTGSTNLSTNTETTLVTAGATPTIYNSLLVSNISAVDANYGIDIVWTDGSNVVQSYLAKSFVIPAFSTVEMLEQSFILPSGHKLKATAQVANTISLTLAGKIT